MPVLSHHTRIPGLAFLAAHMRTPLYRNAYALILSSAVTSGLGMVYWFVAAHMYPTETVGINSAAISAMTLLAGIAQFNLTSAAARFLPTAGRATTRFTGGIYLVSVVAALVASIVFLCGIDIWAPGLSFLNSTPELAAWFVFATMTWSVYVLQDSVLTGLREALWVPIENAVFASLKILLLIVFAGVLAQYGVFASWSAAHTFMLLPTNILILRWLAPRHAKATAGQAEPLVVAQVARFVAGDYLGSLCWLVATTVPTILALEIAGPSAAAYYYLAWMIVSALYNVSAGMGNSLVVEGARDRSQLGAYGRRALLQSLRLVVPVVLLLVIFAPQVLQLVGVSFAGEASLVLRLLSLSAIPNAVTALYVSIARVRRRVKTVFVVYGSLSALVLGLSYGLLHMYGIVGMALAWLLGQTAVALILWLKVRSVCWAPAAGRTAPGEPAPAEAQRHASCSHLRRASYHAQLAAAKLGAPLVAPWGHMRRVRAARATARIVAGELPAIAAQLGAPAPATWAVHHAVETLSSVQVVMAGPCGQPPAVVIKLAGDAHAAASLQKECRSIAGLRADARLGDWRDLLPRPLAAGEIAGCAYEVQEILPGCNAQQLLASPAARARLQKAAAAAIIELHRRTAECVVVGGEWLERWVHRPLAVVQDPGVALASARYDRALARLAERLDAALAGHTMATGWIHGDYAPGNLLATSDEGKITGIVDWELARPDGLPQLDLLQFVLSARMALCHRELGEIVVELLGGAGLAPGEQAMLDAACVIPATEPLDLRSLVLLCWLQHVTGNLTKSGRYAQHPIWLNRNVEPVLRYVQASD